jgi:phage tail sheath protein FI
MERLVSPGVFTKENDLSFLPQGVAEIGAAFIGPTLKGPAFRPVIVESLEDFQRQFGGTTPDFYTPAAVQNYLEEAGRATIVRVLGLNGYDSTVYKSLRLTVTDGTGSATVGIIHPSRAGVALASGSVAGTPTNFELTISGSNGLKTFQSLSIDPTSTNYFVKVLGADPTTKYDGYAYAAFPRAAGFVTGALQGSGSVSLSPATGELNFSGSIFGTYSNAFTPMIRSQTIGGSRYDLFRVWTLSDGNAANRDVKISIVGIRPASIAGQYGTFSLVVRKFDDTDSKVNILEQFDNLTLDPTSPNYIARRIGTARTIIDANGDIYLEGDWPNNSKYIYIDMADGSDVVPTEALPYGFAPLAAPVNRADIPAPAYVNTRYFTPSGATTPVANARVFYGFDFNDETNVSYLSALPSGSATKVGKNTDGTSDVGFDLLTSLAAADATDVLPVTATALRKFTVPFQGGFDGQNPAVERKTGSEITSTNTMGFDLSDSLRDGAKAYKMAIDALANPDAFDINMLVTPGVIYSQHSYVVTEGVNLCEARGDCFYILDGDVLGATADSAVSAVSDLDTNYAATYHPWVKIRDVSTNKMIWVPPSVVIPGVFAFNDRVAAEFFAPAGLNRGGVSKALQVRSRLDQANRDVLYEGRVNPIAIFPGQGICVWGQKTLQHAASALDRINVRRLLIMVKKFIASTSRYLVFEQNTEATRNRFLSIVNPYLSSIQERQGLYAFRVVMDDSNNTPDLIDRNILVGQLYLQPARTAEFISLEFNVLPTGATFPS